MESPVEDPWRRQAHLTIRPVKMRPFRRNRCLGVFLDLVEEDLNKVRWDGTLGYNLSPEERNALRELSEAPNLIIQPSDKGGNVVLLSEKYYEDEILRQLSDQSTYVRLKTNLFPLVIGSLNHKLLLAFKAFLLTRKEFDYLTVIEFNIPTIYTSPEYTRA